MDVGDSLNPAVDIGQIEGAFVQVHTWYFILSVSIYRTIWNKFEMNPTFFENGGLQVYKYRVIHLSPRILNFNNVFQTKPICLKISHVLVNTLRIFSWRFHQKPCSRNFVMALDILTSFSSLWTAHSFASARFSGTFASWSHRKHFWYGTSDPTCDFWY